MIPDDVLDFWENDLGPDKWYKKESVIDQIIQARFLSLWEQAREGDLGDWHQTAKGNLALIIVLDQFPRNMFRDSPKAFSTDGQALSVAQSMIEKKHDWEIPGLTRQFCYMPFMHSENLIDQDFCVKMMAERMTSGNNLHHARKHWEVIEMFGRFPHRNAILDRQSTPVEEKFLAEGGYRA